MKKRELQMLLDKQEIYEVVLRYCRGIDRIDMDLVRSCYWPKAVDHHTGFTGTRDDYIAWVEPLVRGFTGTMHLVGNHLVEVEGDTARSETYGTAYHWGEPATDARQNFVTGFRYLDKFERRKGVWRIARRHAVREWTHRVGEEQRLEREGEGPVGSRDSSDPLYLSTD
jgi:hypothetical protein